jgi:formylglycine-generating enzyme required for sulfatase activity
MALIPGGQFIRGSDEADDTRPVVSVEVAPFYIDRYEVSNSEYRRFLATLNDDDPRKTAWTPLTFEDPRTYAAFLDDQQPVVGISWEAASAYATWVGKRLPTEAEWERAARSRDGRRYPWGDDAAGDYANTADRQPRHEATLAIDRLPTGASPDSVYNMTGNAAEWCADIYQADYYAAAPRRDPLGPSSGFTRVVRGGAWNEPLRPVWYRSFRSADHRSYAIGFRCARSVE